MHDPNAALASMAGLFVVFAIIGLIFLAFVLFLFWKNIWQGRPVTVAGPSEPDTAGQPDTPLHTRVF